MAVAVAFVHGFFRVYPANRQKPGPISRCITSRVAVAGTGGVSTHTHTHRVRPYTRHSSTSGNDGSNFGGNSGGGRGGGDWGDDRGEQPIYPIVPAAAIAFGTRNESLPTWVQNMTVTQFLLVFTVAMYLAQLATADRLTMLLMKQNQSIAAGGWHRLFTPVFLHASITHLFCNCLSLHYSGPIVESWFGSKRFTALYAFGGLTGNLVSFWFTPAPGVGASGAIFGLIGALAVLLIRHRAIIGPNQSQRALSSLGLTVAINFAIGIMPGLYIDNAAHLGGLLGGVLFAYIAGPRLRRVTSLNGRYLVDDPLYAELWRRMRKAIP